MPYIKATYTKKEIGALAQRLAEVADEFKAMAINLVGEDVKDARQQAGEDDCYEFVSVNSESTIRLNINLAQEGETA